MNPYDTEPNRKLIQLQRNRIRLAVWRQRFRLATGREPITVLHPPATATQRVALKAAQSNPVSNANVVKMAAYKRQYLHANLPTEPDSAA